MIGTGLNVRTYRKTTRDHQCHEMDSLSSCLQLRCTRYQPSAVHVRGMYGLRVTGEAAMQGTATAMQQGEGSVFGAYIISTITDGRSAHSATIDHDSSAAKAPANRG